MSILFSASASPDQFVSVGSPTWTVNTFPVTVNLYAKATNLAQVMTTFSLTDTGSAQVYYQGMHRGNDANIVRHVGRNGGLTLNADATTPYVVDQWQMITYVAASATDRRVFVDGANKGTGIDNAPLVGLDTFGLGLRGDGGGQPFDGRIAEAAVWNRTLDDGEVASLLNMPATMVPSGLYYYATYATDFTSITGPDLIPSGSPLPTIDPDQPPVSGGGGPFLKEGLTLGGGLKPSLLK